MSKNGISILTSEMGSTSVLQSTLQGISDRGFPYIWHVWYHFTFLSTIYYSISLSRISITLTFLEYTYTKQNNIARFWLTGSDYLWNIHCTNHSNKVLWETLGYELILLHMSAKCNTSSLINVHSTKPNGVQKYYQYHFSKYLQGLFWKSIRGTETDQFGLTSENFDPF